jgi:hypothetical protein
LPSATLQCFSWLFPIWILHAPLLRPIMKHLHRVHLSSSSRRNLTLTASSRPLLVDFAPADKDTSHALRRLRLLIISSNGQHTNRNSPHSSQMSRRYKRVSCEIFTRTASSSLGDHVASRLYTKKHIMSWINWSSKSNEFSSHSVGVAKFSIKCKRRAM